MNSVTEKSFFNLMRVVQKINENIIKNIFIAPSQDKCDCIKQLSAVA